MDLYRIAIAISMTSNHAAILGALSWHLFHVHTQLNQLTQGFGRLQTAIGGALAVGAGLGMLHVMGKLVEKTKDYSDELVKIQRLGGPNPEFVASGEMEKMAFDISRRVPVSATDVMKIYGSAYSILGKEDSTKMLERLTQSAFVLSQSGVAGGTHDIGKEMATMLRAAERTGMLTSTAGGAADPAQLQRLLDLSTRVIAATHGMVTSQTILGMAQQSGYQLRNLSDEGFMSMAIMAQAMGGQRAGTAFMSLAQQMSGGPAMFARTAEAMGPEGLGLLKAGETVKRGGFGRVGITDEASTRLMGLLQHDPMAFAGDLVRRLTEKYGNDPEAWAREITKISSRQTGARFLGEMVFNYQQMLAERERMGLGMGVIPSLQAQIAGSTKTNLEALSAAWDRFTQALAGPLTGVTITVLDRMRDVLLNLGDWARAHPDLVTNLAIGFTALGAALVVLGGAALVGAMLSFAGAIGPIAFFVTALGTIAALKWDTINNGLNWLATTLGLISKAPPNISPLLKNPNVYANPSIAEDRNYGPEADRSLTGMYIARKMREIQDAWAKVGDIFADIARIGTNIYNEFAPDLARFATWRHNIYAEITAALSDIETAFSKAISTLYQNIKNQILGMFGFSTAPAPVSPGSNNLGRFNDIFPYSGPGPGFGGGIPPIAPSPAPSFNLFNQGASLPGMMPASAVSGHKAQTPINFAVKLDIDGRTLADTLSQRLADLYEFPGQAASAYNGVTGHTPLDSQYG